MVGKWNEREKERENETSSTTSISWSRWVDRSIFRVNGISRVDYATGSRSTVGSRAKGSANRSPNDYDLWDRSRPNLPRSSYQHLRVRSQRNARTVFRSNTRIDINRYFDCTHSPRKMPLTYVILRLRLCNSSKMPSIIHTTSDSSYTSSIFLSSFVSHHY